VPLLREGVDYANARKTLYGNGWSRNALDALPPVEVANLPLRNPVVTRSLTELRKVVNAVIRKYGKPDKIRIELARDLRKSRQERRRITKENFARRGYRADLAGLYFSGRTPGRQDIEKLLLWEECGHQCPYTGKMISFEGLFGDNPQFDVEHIIPFSRCLDDSFLNKTLCYHETNRARKKNLTPYEAFGANEAEWEEITGRVKKFGGDAARIKLERFQMRDLAQFEAFSSRQLNDTRYASRVAKQYLAWLYGDESATRIQVGTGQITAYLRWAWRLNSILKENGGSKGDGEQKTRDDHRHHAIDAVAIALTSPALVKQMSDEAKKQVEEQGRSRGWWRRIEDPWPDFYDDVRAAVNGIVVSHRVSRRVRGGLHDATIYSPPKEDAEGRKYVVMRKPLDERFSAAQIEMIVDPRVREAVDAWLADHDGNSKKAFGDPHCHPCLVDGRTGSRVPIHRVRIRDYRTVSPVGAGAYRRHVWLRDNSHIEICASTDERGEVKKWGGRVVTRLEAYRRIKQGIPVVSRACEDNRRFLFSLTQGDVIEVDMPGSEGEVCRHLFKVRGVSFDAGGRLDCTHINDARKKTEIPAAPSETNTSRFLWRPVIDSLRKRNCRKVTLSPLGDIHPAND
jgi:CRISPR-associated endonuclease Csn1